MPKRISASVKTKIVEAIISLKDEETSFSQMVEIILGRDPEVIKEMTRLAKLKKK